MALSTKNVVEKQVSLKKNLGPGNVLAKINSIELKEDTYSRQNGKDGYFLVLNLEGVDLTDQGFEGFQKVYGDESKGNYKGQIGAVQCGSVSKTGSLYSFSSGTVGTRDMDRDNEIIKFIKESLAKPLGKVEEVDELSANTIEELVSMISRVLSNEEYVHFCLAGKEYEKNGYTNYSLFLPKNDYKAKKFVVATDEDSLLQFDPAIHIIKKKKAEVVDSFAPAQADFVL
jgi:hypothetical protein